MVAPSRIRDVVTCERCDYLIPPRRKAAWQEPCEPAHRSGTLFLSFSHSSGRDSALSAGSVPAGRWSWPQMLEAAARSVGYGRSVIKVTAFYAVSA